MADITDFKDYRLVERHEAWTPAGPVVSRLAEPEIQALEGRTIATVGESSTLAVFGFATGTWMAGAVFGGFLPGAQLALAPVLILFAGIAQFIAGLYAFRRANTLGANAFCCYGAYNTVIGVILLFEAGGMIPKGAGADTILGWFNCSFAFISLAFLLSALRKNMAMAAMLATLGCGYALIGISRFYIGPGGELGAIAAAGGALLFASAFCAYYLGMAMVVNSSWQRVVFPIFGEP